MLENTLEAPRDAAVDALRAGTWTLLGRLLMAPPSQELRVRLMQIAAEEHADDMGAAWAGLAAASREADEQALAREYQEVFIGVGGGEVVPYASWYFDESLASRPLVRLREELEQLGLGLQEGSSETEDHAGAVCEIMGFVVQDEEVDFAWQKAFFEQHLNGWLGRFFEDLARAPSARYYLAVAALGTAFLELERKFFAMPV